MARKKETRFEKVSEQSLSIGTSLAVIVDRQTGVNYLLTTSGYGVSVTPLLDAAGNPLIDLPRSSTSPEL